jgi:hypothetical protein
MRASWAAHLTMSHPAFPVSTWVSIARDTERGGERLLYQDSSISALRTPRDLIRKRAGSDMLPAGTLMFCGTPGAIGGIRPATRFEMELRDPVLNRSLTHNYDVEVLSVVS